LFGIGAAVLGLAGYATLVVILQDGRLAIFRWAWVTLGQSHDDRVEGLGGRRYQITAALLTYAAVSMAAVPIQLALSAKHKPTQQEQAHRSRNSLKKNQGSNRRLRRKNIDHGLGLHWIFGADWIGISFS